MAGKKQQFSFSTMHLSDIPRFIIALFKGQVGPEEEVMKEQTGFYEINLVPDVKTEMIRMQKIRNLVFFICLVVVIGSGAVTAILGSIKVAQDLTMSGQDEHLKNLSKKITSYEELPEFLTVQNQLRGIAEIEDKQKVLSRALIFFAALQDVGIDKVQASELSVDLTSTTLTFDAQADAVKDDIDYRVLEAFIKRTNLMSFDYGRYVDAEGKEIPSRCLQEYDLNNKMYEENGSIYAIWNRGKKGCDPSRDDYAVNEDGTVTIPQTNADLESTKMNDGVSEVAKVGNSQKGADKQNVEKEQTEKKKINYVPSEKIYRTPQFTDWYNKKAVRTSEDGIDDKAPTPPNSNTVYNVTNYKYTPTMDTGGVVSGVPHFESKCITYTGEVTTDEKSGKEVVKWSSDNKCKMVPNGIEITQSANGRDKNDRLVLSFSATVKFNADAFAFKNKHVMAVGPNGQNVTDSYVQLQKIFTAPATKCSTGDTECNVKNKNKTGE